jgi:hypothetical protein
MMVGEDTTPAESNIYRKAQTKDCKRGHDSGGGEDLSKSTNERLQTRSRLRRRQISIEKHKRKNANEDTTPAEANIYRKAQAKDVFRLRRSRTFLS